MRKYRSTNGMERTATMEMLPESYGFYQGSHVLVSTESERGHACARFGNYAQGFEWLVSEFGQGWTRVRD